MIQSVKTASHAIIAQQNRLDVIANNLANINTTGFKRVRPEFGDMLYRERQRVVETGDNPLSMQMGHGVLLASTIRDNTVGTRVGTDNPMDFALTGPGYFAVRMADGRTAYTRAGEMSASVEEDGTYLTTKDGRYVLDKSGERIGIQGKLAELRVDQMGNLQDEAGTIYASMGIYTFDNPQGLEERDGMMLLETEASGQPRENTQKVLEQSSIEGSNVDISREMTMMIRAQRALSMAARALTAADEMDATAINIRG